MLSHATSSKVSIPGETTFTKRRGAFSEAFSEVQTDFVDGIFLREKIDSAVFFYD